MGEGKSEKAGRDLRGQPPASLLPWCPLGVEPRPSSHHRQEREAAQEDRGGDADQCHWSGGDHIPGWGPWQVSASCGASWVQRGPHTGADEFYLGRQEMV